MGQGESTAAQPRLGHRLHRDVLPHHALVQLVRQVQQLLALAVAVQVGI
jgi:hypothetical protein